ncbi:MAG TPA: DNA-directed RNA polymerase subunit N [Candidatus Woesearchaeota archaeon]|nr:DNA-directed RNA polymerase subunit N [Candidatus Woesearchaeota archaeon]
MIIPIRCFSCGKPLAHLWQDYLSHIKAGKTPKKAMDELGVERYCCRSVFLGNADLADIIGRFRKG